LITVLRCNILNKQLLEADNDQTKSDLIRLKFGILSKMKNLVKKFKVIYKKYESYSTTKEGIVINLNSDCVSRRNEIYSHFDKAPNVARNCRRIVNDQKEINQRVNEFLYY
jgi:hypothetical protein